MREFFFNLTANHVGNDFIHSKVYEITFCYVVAISHDRNSVCNMCKLFQTM